MQQILYAHKLYTTFVGTCNINFLCVVLKLGLQVYYMYVLMKDLTSKIKQN